MISTLIQLVACGVLAQTGGAPASGEATSPSEPPGVYQAEVRIEIPLGRRSVEPVVARVDLPAKLLEELGPEGIGWSPGGVSGGLVLKSLSDGREVPLLPAPADRPSIEYSFTRPKITTGRPGQVKLAVNDPWGLRDGLGPGVFRGALPIALYHPKVMDGTQPIRAVVPVLLVMPGVRLTSMRFTDRDASGGLRVGRKASVEVTLETFGSPPGRGRLELDWWPTGATAPVPLLRARVPFGVAAWDPIEPRAGWANHPQWSGSAIPEVVQESEPVASPTPGLGVERRRLLAELPELFETGKVGGRVVWPTDPAAEGSPGQSVAVEPIPVGPGLLAGPRVAMLGEAIRVSLVARPGELGDPSTWGDAIPLNPGGPVADGPAPSLRRQGSGGGLEVLYYGEFYPTRAGVYSVAPGTGAPEAVIASVAPVEVRVPLQWGSRLPDEPPLTAFVDSTPWWWSLAYSSEHGNREVVRRREAFGLRLAWPGWRDVNVRLVGVFHNDGDRAGDRVNPSRDPSIEFRPTGQGADGAPGGSWPLTVSDPLRMDLVVDVRPTSADADGDRRRLRTEPFIARWLIVGVDPSGRPAARIFSQPFRVRVASQHELEYMGWTLLLLFLAFLALVLVLVRIARRGTAGRTQRPATDPDGGEEGGPRLVEDFDDGAPAHRDFAIPDADRGEGQGPAAREEGFDETPPSALPASGYDFND